MIVVQGHVRVAPADMEGLREAARAMVAATRAEDGCIAYTFAEDVLDPGLVHIIERWRDAAAMGAHGKTPHMAAFGAALAKAKPQGLRVATYETAEERVIMGA